MKTRTEIEIMLARFDEIDHDEIAHGPVEGIHEALLWVLGHREDYSLEVHLPE